ncbi:MAG: acyltransferase family protein [Candidatus Ornithomonoglobus sp.]
MLDYLIMGAVLLFLFTIWFYNAKYLPEGNDGFFNQDTSKAMRGFWCLIVILVHIPAAYQNRIQDLIGSFAYIGVTFFFMTSAYGLSLGISKNHLSIKKYWRKRLPKLIVPNWIINIIFAVVLLIAFHQHPTISSVIRINGWVEWLLVCYFMFWIGHFFIKNYKIGSIVLCCLVSAFSIILYWMKTKGIVTSTTWCTEVYGFIWGTLLMSFGNKIKYFFQRKWLINVATFCFIALMFGILYLKYKPIVFVGDYLLKIVLGIAIISLILVFNSKISIGNKVSWFLGEISFEVYLIHGHVFHLISRACSNMTSGVFILLSMAITVFIATIIHYLCKWIFRLIYSTSFFKAID